MYRIGEFSKLSKVTVKTLRYYGDIGLFPPAHTDAETGYRYYTSEQIGALNEILRFRSMGLPIEDIAHILKGADIKAILESRLSMLKTELNDTRTRISLVIETIKQLKEKKMEYQASIKKLPECIAYYRKGVIETYADISSFVLEAGAECISNNPTLECVDYCWISYTAEGYQERDIELTYYEAVKTYGKESQNIKFARFDEVDAVCVEHKGAYSRLSEAYAFAIKYVEENGYAISEAIREKYIDGCWNKDSEEEYLTEIQIPVAKL